MFDLSLKHPHYAASKPPSFLSSVSLLFCGFPGLCTVSSTATWLCWGRWIVQYIGYSRGAEQIPCPGQHAS